MMLLRAKTPFLLRRGERKRGLAFELPDEQDAAVSKSVLSYSGLCAERGSRTCKHAEPAIRAADGEPGLAECHQGDRDSRALPQA